MIDIAVFAQDAVSRASCERQILSDRASRAGALKKCCCRTVLTDSYDSFCCTIWHDGQGACLFTKRLERGRFLWPSPADGVVTISSAQLGYLLSGIDWRHPQQTWRPTSVG
jgi:transposase